MSNAYTYEDVVNQNSGKPPSRNFDSNSFLNERILVTGAGGSIGSKIVLELSNCRDVQLLATDRDENRLHSLSLQLIGSALFNTASFKVMDVRDFQGIENCVSEFNPSIIIHAAALKHLAVLEKQPREAYLTNVLGTSNMLSIAYKYKVGKFLNISTDKAANPISVLGKSKYIGELLTAKYREIGAKNFTSVRFGNVFNSQGSVIETFSQQLEANLPVTLTDINVARYFMKLEEAANLSLSAIILNQGEVHILEMGEQIKLIDIIHRMKEISGSRSEIKLVGLRSGEKLSEELHAENEILLKTKNPAIFSIKITNKYLDLPRIPNEVINDIEALREINALIPN